MSRKLGAIQSDEGRKARDMRMNIVSPLIVLLIVWGAIWDFHRRMKSTVPQTELPSLAVVFSGKYDRVWRGLDLLERSQIKRLYISGANATSGVSVERFVTQFSLDAELLEALTEGRIVLGPRAHDTLQNATETKCWLDQQAREEPILLITSTSHMPRASLALEQELPGRKIWRMSVPEGVNQGGKYILRKEFQKYLGTLVITQLPARLGKKLRAKFGILPPLDCP